MWTAFVLGGNPCMSRTSGRIWESYAFSSCSSCVSWSMPLRIVAIFVNWGTLLLNLSKCWIASFKSHLLIEFSSRDRTLFLWYEELTVCYLCWCYKCPIFKNMLVKVFFFTMIVGWKWSLFQDQKKHTIEEADECLLWSPICWVQLNCLLVRWPSSPWRANSWWGISHHTFAYTGSHMHG